jgi:two-component system, NarL family, sensor kinase
VDNPVHRLIDYFATEPVRVSAILRLPLIGLIAVLVWIWEVDHWLPGLYAVILGVYAVAAVLWLIAVLRSSRCAWYPAGRHRHFCPCSSCCRSRSRSATAPL